MLALRHAGRLASGWLLPALGARALSSSSARTALSDSDRIYTNLYGR